MFFNLKFNATYSFNEQGLTNLKTIQDNIQPYMTPYGVNIVIYLLNNSIVFSVVVDNIYNYDPQLSQIKIDEIP